MYNICRILKTFCNANSVIKGGQRQVEEMKGMKNQKSKGTGDDKQQPEKK